MNGCSSRSVCSKTHARLRRDAARSFGRRAAQLDLRDLQVPVAELAPRETRAPCAPPRRTGSPPAAAWRRAVTSFGAAHDPAVRQRGGPGRPRSGARRIAEVGQVVDVAQDEAPGVPELVHEVAAAPPACRSRSECRCPGVVPTTSAEPQRVGAVARRSARAGSGRCPSSCSSSRRRRGRARAGRRRGTGTSPIISMPSMIIRATQKNRMS